MTAPFPIAPLAWNWWVEFFISMGLTTAVALSFALGLLCIDWLYLMAKRIESGPVPQHSYWRARWNLSRFTAIALGVLAAPVVAIGGYSVLSSLVWKLAPAMVDSGEPDSGALSILETPQAMATALMLSFATAQTIVLGLFFVLRHFGILADTRKPRIGLFLRFAKRYFHDTSLVGILLMVIAMPVATIFFYNLAIFLLVVSPSSRHRLDQVILPNADTLYMHGLIPLSSALPVVLLIPFLWLFFVRGGILLGRYLKENIPMNLLFRRTIKLYAVSFFGFSGYMVMGYWAQTFLKFIVSTLVK